MTPIGELFITGHHHNNAAKNTNKPTCKPSAIVTGLVGWFLSLIMIVNLLGKRPMLNKTTF
ncbi:hypothetical protein Nizo1840_0387 [Lactiplantibacillus plantarum]|jgi:hypothetical protein|nr:hypothetical protein SF2A35B_2706 [Lactiplantibacillus plantarum]KZT79040.1 hypothetical protein Nizo1839_2342 [Lactiplantibacillus plantarum]KZT89489.1 hypothetical protein Nizo1840_0387 [Lactiplantibacillus plantarum]KZU16054.1 hypothetical protein Nizo2264_0184 [Lactiplantibacillus plantarum]